LFIARVVNTGETLFISWNQSEQYFSVKMEDKKGILYKGGCLCGKIIFKIIRGIQQNIFANKAAHRL
jgi:hypothetical protein